MKTLLLIDAHAMIHRAFHALPPELKSKKGVPTNAIYGFFLMLQKVIVDFKPTHLAVCFDTPVPTFRKKLFKEYQGKRPPMDDTLKPQIPLIEGLLKAGGVSCFKKEGFEADDVIGTIAKAEENSVDRTLILTGDRDLLQLVDDQIFVITPKFGVTNFNLYTQKEVVNRFSVEPNQIPDYKALAGDSSDNYNTARGIGPKTATKLLHQFVTIENMLKNSSQIENEKWKKIVENHKDTIALFKKVATIVTDVDVKFELKNLEFNGFKENIKKQLSELDLYTLNVKLFNNKKEEPKPVKEKKKIDTSQQIDLFG